MTDSPLSRDDIAERYLEQLTYEPYPVQEEALLAWFSADQGVLVCAPTGTGKTLIAEAALFEALHTGKTAYYTTPLIALTEQKFREMQAAAVRWGFHADDVGLVTGNRRENPGARVLVVVAEILFNRLLHQEAFDFTDVSTVVMDEFHSFNDPERGIVWEFTLGLLPEHVRTLLLSATVGNSREFVAWLRNFHRRRLDLVESFDRKVPLTYRWVGDQLLTEQIEGMAEGDGEARFTPALVFCFNREECWTIAEQLKGKGLLAPGQQAQLTAELNEHDWSQGAGPKLRQLLLRGVGVHHAGILPKYRRIVEDLFQKKLLSVATCTETLSAGINLPARSVVLPSIMKGPPGEMKILEPSTAHQIFGRAGRPQFDTQGFVFVLAHEDDVKIARWREKYDRIPEDTKDPGLMKAKKALKKKAPTRRATEQYWNEAQFEKLKAAPPGRLGSRGRLPWRFLAHVLTASPDVELVRKLVSRRLLAPKWLDQAQADLDKMLLILWRAGYVRLEPEPPASLGQPLVTPEPELAELPDEPEESFGAGIFDSVAKPVEAAPPQTKPAPIKPAEAAAAGDAEPYRPMLAHPTERLPDLLKLRGINPLYGLWLIERLGIADRAERLQAMESVLELPRSMNYFVRVPSQKHLPRGPLATTWLDEDLLRLGLVTADQIVMQEEDPEEDRHRMFAEERPRVLHLADKLRLRFDYDFPGVHDLRTAPVWVAGELLEFGGDFNKYVTSKALQKQEGVIFRHLLRLILLVGEFLQFCPPETNDTDWRADLSEVSYVLTESCRKVDPQSTEKALADVETVKTVELAV